MTKTRTSKAAQQGTKTATKSKSGRDYQPDMGRILEVYRQLGLETEQQRAAQRQYALLPQPEPEEEYVTYLSGSCTLTSFRQ